MVMTFDVRDNSEDVSYVCKIIFGRKDNDYLMVDRTISILDIRDEQQQRYCLRIEDIDDLIKALKKAKEFYDN